MKQTFCVLLVASMISISSCCLAINTGPRAPALESSANSTFIQLIEQQFMRWVDWLGSLKHSLFNVARNQLVCHLRIVVDARPGIGHFHTVQAAVDSIMDFNPLRVVIQINAGVYTERVYIPATKPFVTFQGAGSNKTIIQWNDTADKVGKDGNALGTFNSATVGVDAAYFIARNITFKNVAPAPPPGAAGKQAVAFRISGDTAIFLGCRFLGAQDTLYDHRGRHYFKDCYVEGSVDFIFGDGLSMYDNCHMHAIDVRYGAVTAQKRASLLEDTGFSFVHCKVTGSGLLYLGRAWGTFSRVVYSYTFMDNIIIPKGWDNWGDPGREGTVFYGQYKCYGPGANCNSRVPWSRELTTSEAQPFIDLNFIDGHEWVEL